MREEDDPCACTHTIAKWHVFGGNRIGALTLGTLAPGPRAYSLGLGSGFGVLISYYVCKRCKA